MKLNYENRDMHTEIVKKEVLDFNSASTKTQCVKITQKSLALHHNLTLSTLGCT
mgnify:CR=1 FL=1